MHTKREKHTLLITPSWVRITFLRSLKLLLLYLYVMLVKETVDIPSITLVICAIFNLLFS